ncbi:MAG: thioredoxin domain-containing protein [Actinobacteria bacterium]|nr:thioredoxin domain-containing protein [Actinomycetota bacterium]
MGKGDKEARTEAQARLAAERAAQKAADRRRSLIFGGATVAVVVVIIGLVIFSVSQQSKSASDVGPLPKGANESTYGIEIGAGAINGGGDSEFNVKAAGAKIPVLDFYEDFQCPACKTFEDATSAGVNKLLSQGKVKAVYHVLAFLDRNLNNDASLRSANASACAADEGKFLIFHDIVYTNQPKEGTGYTDQELLQFGADAGITSKDFQTCVTGLKYQKWVQNGVQREAENRPVTATPTLYINGKELERPITNESIAAAVAKASK